MTQKLKIQGLLKGGCTVLTGCWLLARSREPRCGGKRVEKVP